MDGNGDFPSIFPWKNQSWVLRHPTEALTILMTVDRGCLKGTRFEPFPHFEDHPT